MRHAVGQWAYAGRDRVMTLSCRKQQRAVRLCNRTA